MWIRRLMATMLVVFSVVAPACSGTKESSKTSADETSASLPTAWVIGGTEVRAAPSIGPDEPLEIWSRDVGEMVDDFHVLDDRLFYATRTSAETYDMVAVDLDDGVELWRSSLEGSIPSAARQGATWDEGYPSPTLLDLDVYVVAHDTDGTYVRLDPDTGETVWSTAITDSPYAEVIGSGVDACLHTTKTGPSGDQKLTCIGLSDGEEAWSASGYPRGSSSTTAYVAADETLTAHDLETGEPKWRLLAVDPQRVVEVGGVAVLCDAEGASGIDRSGLIQWTTSTTTGSCYPGSDFVLVSAENSLSVLDPDDGSVEAHDGRTLGYFTPESLYGSRFLVGSSSIVDLQSDNVTSLDHMGSSYQVAGGILEVAPKAKMEGSGPGGWLVRGYSAMSQTWKADVGWTWPSVVPVDDGVLIIDFEYGGNLWMGGPGGAGPSLSKAAAGVSDSQQPPASPPIDGGSVLGVPFGTPWSEARSTLVDLLGPPSAWNDLYRDGQPAFSMWGTLEITAEQQGDEVVLARWRDYGRGWSTAWPLPGGVTPWSSREQVAAVGYLPIDESQNCRESVCFHLYEEEGAEGGGVSAPPWD